MTPAEIRAARKQLGLTQAELSAVMGYSRGAKTVSDWEVGVSEMPPPTARLLRAYLDGYRPQDWPST
jgi:DNA-binding transcriptional regulator YiaG